MQEQPTGPTPNTSAQDDPKARVDRMPSTPEEWATFATLPAADRAAAYLRSIRSMVLFFTVLLIVGIVGLMVTGLSRNG